MINKEKVKDMYLFKKMSIRKIALDLGKDEATIFNFMKKNNIPIRSRTEANKNRFNDQKERDKIREGMLGKNKGKDNGNWKGDNPCYQTLHYRIRTSKPKPSLCEECGLKPSYEVANISGEYKQDLMD